MCYKQNLEIFKSFGLVEYINENQVKVPTYKALVYKYNIIKIENWWIKYNQPDYKYCVGNCQKFIENTQFIGQLPTTEMGCYNYIYMCENCIEQLPIENYSICEGYCIGSCENVIENAILIGKYNEINIYMCESCIQKINNSDTFSQDSQDYCYKCNDYGRCYDCQPFNPVFDTWGLPRGFTKMSREELKKYSL